MFNELIDGSGIKNIAHKGVGHHLTCSKLYSRLEVGQQHGLFRCPELPLAGAADPSAVDQWAEPYAQPTYLHPRQLCDLARLSAFLLALAARHDINGQYYA